MFIQPEHLGPRAEAEPKRGDDRGAPEPASTRGSGDDVSPSVGDVEMARVAACRLTNTQSRAMLGAWVNKVRFALVWTARPELVHRARADQLRTCARVFAREKSLERHVDESGIPVPCFAIRERQLRALNDRVHVGVRQEPECSEIELVEKHQLLQKDWRLAPGAPFQHGEAVVVDRNRLLVASLPARKVTFGEEATVPTA